jgi:hypothetical protein
MPHHLKNRLSGGSPSWELPLRINIRFAELGWFRINHRVDAERIRVASLRTNRDPKPTPWK